MQITKKKLDELERAWGVAPEKMPVYYFGMAQHSIPKEQTNFYNKAYAAFPALLEAAREVLEWDEAPLIKNPPELNKCSFCGKQREEVKKLIAGPDYAMICNECVEVSVNILINEHGILLDIASQPKEEG